MPLKVPFETLNVLKVPFRALPGHWEPGNDQLTSG
jgi:hypothetical protein